MTKIYTRGGDKGMTSLIGGTRIPKSDPRLNAYGTVDELSSALGVCQATLASLIPTSPSLQSLSTQILRIQNRLFFIGSRLAAEDEPIRQQLPPLPENSLEELEQQIDLWTTELPPLKEFILPGGSLGAAHLHLARCICRRAERALAELPETALSDELRYLNRLSDYLFTAARWTNFSLRIPDQTWKKDES